MKLAFTILTSGLAAVIASLLPVAAQQRTVIARLACADAIALVKRQGDVVLSIAGGASERFVSDRGHCEMTEIAELRFVPTRDNPQCPVGYRCKAPEFEDWNIK